MEKIENFNLALAAAVKKARMKIGLTQAQLAGLAGLSEVYISQLERAERGDSLNAFMQLAAALKMKGSTLLSLVENEMLIGVVINPVRKGRPPKTQ